MAVTDINSLTFRGDTFNLKDPTKYVKPSGGIPQTDLEQTVQNKLDKTVVVSDTQPTETENKLWVNIDAGSGNSYQIPTVAEMEAADNSILGNLAMIESSPATQAHAVGEYIVYNGQLYKVTAAIAQGESLVSGTNVRSTTFGDQHIIRSGTYTLDSGISFESWGRVNVYRCGDLVCISGSGVKNSQVNLQTNGINVPWKSNIEVFVSSTQNGIVKIAKGSKKIIVQASQNKVGSEFQIIYFTDDP